jgi:hypothetical protein
MEKQCGLDQVLTQVRPVIAPSHMRQFMLENLFDGARVTFHGFSEWKEDRRVNEAQDHRAVPVRRNFQRHFSANPESPTEISEEFLQDSPRRQ